MKNKESDTNKYIGLGKLVLRFFTRGYLVCILGGVLGTLFLQLLAGFWLFRNEHQEIVRV